MSLGLLVCINSDETVWVFNTPGCLQREKETLKGKGNYLFISMRFFRTAKY
jgi:hypothetical protein